MSSGKKAVTVCKRALRGLFAGRSVRFGNNVSEDGGNRTRRMWKPNAQKKRVYSEMLDRMVPISLTTHTLRCIDKAGGLDSYILNAKPAELGTGIGLKLRAALGMMRELTSEAGRLAAPTDAAAPSKQS